MSSGENVVGSVVDTFNIEELPIAYYVVQSRDGRDEIVECNTHFAHLFDFDSPSEVLGRDIQSMHAVTSRYGAFLARLRDEGRSGRRLETFREKIQTRSGRIRTVEIWCQLRRDPDGHEIGRTGFIRDVTVEAQLSVDMYTLAEQMAQTLHYHATALQRTKYSITPALRALRRGWTDDVDRPAAITPARLSELADEIAGEVQILLQYAEIAQGADGTLVPLLKKFHQELVNHRHEIFQAVFYPSSLRELAVRMLALLDENDVSVSESVANRARNAALVLERACCAASLDGVQEAVVRADHELRAVRNFVMRSVVFADTPTICDLHELVRTAIRDSIEYADHRKIKILRPITEFGIKVEVPQTDMVRAIANIVQNAIKYSDVRVAVSPEITVSCFLSGDNFAVVEVSNRGIGIPPDELESGLIFKLGTRGRLAEQGFSGTGIGLTDSLRVVESVGGVIRIASAPLPAAYQTIDRVLHETRVCIHLPNAVAPQPAVEASHDQT